MSQVDPQRSATMRAIRSRDTALESRLSSALWRHGCRYRRNVASVFGCPDFCVKARKVAVFVDSCFWHGCEDHCRMPRSNTEYWNAKIERNRERDRLVTETLKKEGWTVIRVWEHEIEDDLDAVVDSLLGSPLRRDSCESERSVGD